MSTPKEDIQIEKICELLKQDPTDDGTFYGALYELSVFIGIIKGVEDIRNGRAMDLKEFNKEMEELHESYL